METWKKIPGWEGLYEASDQGRVRSLNRIVAGRFGPTRYKGRVLVDNGVPYPHIRLANTGAGRLENWYVHDLVLLAFVGPKPEGLEVCHANDTRRDNRLTNLRYDTRSANAQEGLVNRGHIHQTSEQKKEYHREYKKQWRARRREQGLPVT